jgi:hypothetical protein
VVGARRDAQHESQRRSVEHLQELYSVVVAIALSLAIDRAVRTAPSGAHMRAAVLVVALLVTLIPFYHGALRHLDEQYGGEELRAAHEFSILVDFLLLFLESCVFLALAVSISRPTWFAWLFVALLVLDVTWAYLTTRYLGRSSEQDTQRKWLVLNFLSCVGLVAVLGVLFAADLVSATTLSYLLCASAVARSAIDYKLAWKFYVAAPQRRGL